MKKILQSYCKKSLKSLRLTWFMLIKNVHLQSFGRETGYFYRDFYGDYKNYLKEY